VTRPRTFQLHRDQDPTGISGTGVVAEGCEFTDGKTVLRWLGEHPSVNTFDTLGAAEAEAVHGHGGMTRLVFPAEQPDERDQLLRAVRAVYSKWGTRPLPEHQQLMHELYCAIALGETPTEENTRA
jgi:hypothetical protein